MPPIMLDLALPRASFITIPMSTKGFRSAFLNQVFGILDCVINDFFLTHLLKQLSDRGYRLLLANFCLRALRAKPRRQVLLLLSLFYSSLFIFFSTLFPSPSWRGRTRAYPPTPTLWLRIQTRLNRANVQTDRAIPGKTLGLIVIRTLILPHRITTHQQLLSSRYPHYL